MEMQFKCMEIAYFLGKSGKLEFAVKYIAEMERKCGVK